MREKRPHVLDGAILINDLTPLANAEPRIVRRIAIDELRRHSRMERGLEALKRKEEKRRLLRRPASQSDGGR